MVLVACGLLVALLFAFTGRPPKKKDPGFAARQSHWVDSVFASLTPRERLSQLFMVAAYSNDDMAHVRATNELITNYNIGGLVWMQGSPVKQGKLANYYQSLAKTPLLYGIDAEWGLAMRMDSTPGYPKQITLGAIQDDSLIYAMGRQIAQECKRMGIHINFAPVANLNRSDKQVTSMRSFGEDQNNVARKSAMYMKGMQDAQVLACAKYFPAYGGLDADSMSVYPAAGQQPLVYDSAELYPFRGLFRNGMGAVMVAGQSFTGLDKDAGKTAFISAGVVKDMLRKQLGFNGLVITEALGAKVKGLEQPGQLELKALQAGNDMLLLSSSVTEAIEAVNKAIQAGRISQKQIDEHCKKVLKAKYWCGLYRKQEVVTRNLDKELNTEKAGEINEKLAGAAVTLLKNDQDFLPLKRPDTLRTLVLSFGAEESNALYNTLKSYGYAEHAGLAHNAGAEKIADVFERVSEADLVIIQLNKTGPKSGNNPGLLTQSLRLMDSIAGLKPSILVMQSNPYLLSNVQNMPRFRAIIMANETLPSLLKASARVIIGATGPKGRLPVNTTSFKSESGLSFEAINTQQEVKLKENYMSEKFGAIDSLALTGIAQRAYPGCQIVALKDGKVIYQRSFGNYTYNKDSKPVDNGTLYDLASVTKIASSSLALMRLSSENKLDYKKTLGDYLPGLSGTNKEKLVIEEVLAHQAGLQAWIPFYQATLQKGGRYKLGYYSKKFSEEFPTPVAKNLYAVKGIKDTLYDNLRRSKLETPGKYLYSDLGYYFMQQIIEQQTQKRLDEYVQALYAKAGIGLTYRPLNYFSKLQVAPTENDTRFRKQLVQGYVHDPGAALIGGVAGHAGLFGNALELSKLMQLFLNKGELNGVRLLDSNVVKDYTACHFCPGNRRGLCFEKPETDPRKDSPVTGECSPESFGHSGFTGTFAWADPKNNLVVVFLSNRVYPDADENRLTKLGIRGKIHKAFYDALKNDK